MIARFMNKDIRCDDSAIAGLSLLYSIIDAVGSVHADIVA